MTLSETPTVNTRPGVKLEMTRESNSDIVTHDSRVTPHDSWMATPGVVAGRSAPPKYADRGRVGVGGGEDGGW